MEWAAKETRIAELCKANKCGKSANKIYELLRKLNILRMFVYRITDRFSQISIVEEWSSSLGSNHLSHKNCSRPGWLTNHARKTNRKALSKPY